MADLVERLLDPSKGSPRWASTMEEAAAEIARLRAALLYIAQQWPDSAAARHARATLREKAHAE